MIQPLAALILQDTNTRETASLVWAIAALLVALAIPSLRASVSALVSVVLRPFTAVLLASTTLLAAATTGGLALIGYWRPSMVAATAAWFVGTAIAGTFRMGGVRELQLLALRAVALAGLIEFVSNAYTFPLWMELFLVPGVVVFVTLASFADLRPEFAIVRAPLRMISIALFVGTLTPTVVYVIQHLGKLENAERAREFLLPLVLTVAFLPYLYAVRMVVVWQTALSMLRFGMQDRPALLKKARRSLITSCRGSLSRIQLFEPRFRWMLASAASYEDIDRTFREFERVAAEHPRRNWRESLAAVTKVGVRELLPGSGNSNFIVRSIALADRVQTALCAAAASLDATEAELRELLDRLNLLSELNAVSAVSRAEVIRILAERGRSITEIEAIAPERGKLVTMHAADFVSIADEFDPLLRLAGLSAAEAPRIAGELHAMSAITGLPLHDTIEAFVTLLGGAGDSSQETDPPTSEQ
jgi:hypothetical protein